MHFAVFELAFIDSRVFEKDLNSISMHSLLKKLASIKKVCIEEKKSLGKLSFFGGHSEIDAIFVLLDCGFW